MGNGTLGVFPNLRTCGALVNQYVVWIIELLQQVSILLLDQLLGMPNCTTHAHSTWRQDNLTTKSK